MPTRYYYGSDAAKSFPDGFVCPGCGKEFSDKTTDVSQLFAVVPDDGPAVCIDCHKSDLNTFLDTLTATLKSIKATQNANRAAATDDKGTSQSD